MYVIHNADAATWLQSYEGGLVWTAALEEAVQFATEAEAKAVCCANGICECWVEEA